MEITAIEHDLTAKIKVVGCGGGGGNAVNNMILSALSGVDFIVLNTDAQAIDNSLAEHKIHIGTKLTKGLGAGANPDVGREAALESIDEITAAISGADMVFVTAGMGGGTGTGAAPIVAQAAREAGALVVGVVTKPFFYEGRRRLMIADEGIKNLAQQVDSIITIPNDRLVQHAAKQANLPDMLRKADEVLYYATKGISDLITIHGLINLDFADVKAVMADSGLALMGTGISTGEGRAKDAALKAITSPLLEDISIDGAKGILYNITCSSSVLMSEATEAADTIASAADPDANIFFGIVIDDSLGEDMRITVIATGIQQQNVIGTDQSDKQGRRNSNIIELDDVQRNLKHQPPYRRVGKSVENSDVPAYLRKKKHGQELRGLAEVNAAPGAVQYLGDDDTPTFMRKNQS